MGRGRGTDEGNSEEDIPRAGSRAGSREDEAERDPLSDGRN